MHVVIVGGSLVGLMHGIMLKHHGCDVDILEQTPSRLEGQAAGVGTGMKTHSFLASHDRVKGAFAFPTEGIRIVNVKNQVETEVKLSMALTSWDALYFRLRANFDGCVSVFVPEVPDNEETDGKTTYQTGKKVVSVSSIKGGKKVSISYKDAQSGETRTTIADMVIAADGANSTVRQLLSPQASGRRFSGYVMWRGLVPEMELSPKTRNSTWLSFCPVPRRSEVVVLYPIPGKTGSLRDGERDINFAWYSHISADDLSEALTDVDGHRHNWSVPSGKIDPAVWQRQLAHAPGSLNSACAELAAKIERPFLQVVGDHTAPQASFLGGRVLLVGDALATLRPHSGSGISSGAFHALKLEDVMFGRGRLDYVAMGHTAAMRGWERDMLDASEIEHLKSISWGEYYMGGWLGWLPAAARYHCRLKLQACKNWLAGIL